MKSEPVDRGAFALVVDAGEQIENEDLAQTGSIRPRYAFIGRNTTDVEVTITLFNQEIFDDSEENITVAEIILDPGESAQAIIEGLFIGGAPSRIRCSATNVGDAGELQWVLREAS